MKQGLVLLALGIVLGICPQISQAGFITFVATLAPEATGATGTGFAQVDFDIVAHQMRVQVSFAGLSGNTTVSHIHGDTGRRDCGRHDYNTLVQRFPCRCEVWNV